MPDYGWAYVNLDVLKTIEGPNITGAVGIIKDSTTFSGSHYFAYATASDKVGVGLNFPTTLPSYQLDVSASSGETTALRTIGDLQVSGSALISGSIVASSLHVDTIISSSNLIVRDEIIGLGFGSGTGETGSVGDRGFIFGLPTNANQAIIWDQTSGSFVFGKVRAQGPHATAFDIPAADLSTVKAGTLTGSVGVSGSLGEFGSITLAGAALSTGVSTSGTPADNQIAIFTDADTIEGSSKLTFNGSILTLDAPLSSSGGVQAVGDSVFGGKLDVSSSATFAGTIKASGLGTDTDSTVVIVNSSGFLKTDEADSRIFGSSLVDATGTPVDNQLAIFTDANTVEGSSKLTFDGTKFELDGSISGSSTLQIVGTIDSTGNIASSGSISGSTAEFGNITLNGVTANTVSGSGVLEMVGVTTLGDNLLVSGTIKAPNIGAGTDNSVVVLNASGFLKTDEADGRIFGSTLVGNTGSPANNQLAIFTDSTTVEGSNKVTFDGSLLAIDANVSGSGTLQSVGNAVLGGDVNISGTLKAAGDVNVARKIIHDGDTDTLIDFTDDNIEFKVGNVKLLNLAEASDNVVTVGNGGDVDFQVKTQNNNNTIFAEGSTDRIGLGTGTPDARLHMSQSSGYPTSMPKPLIKIEHVLDADSGGGGGPTTTPLLILTGTAPSGEDYAEGRLAVNKSAPAGALHVVSKGTDCIVANDGRVAIGHAGPDTVLDVRGENKIFRVVNSKNDSSTNMFFVSGAGENVGHFGSNATGVTLTVSGSSQLAGVTATTISASSTLQAVGNAIIGGNLAVSGTINFSGGDINNTTIGGTTPAPVNQTAGTVKYRSKDNGDSPYSVVASDYIIGVDTSGGAVQINLQAAATAGTGRMLIIKDTKGTAGTNNITIEPNGSEKIDRQLNMVIAANSGSVILFCDGSEYFIAGTR